MADSRHWMAVLALAVTLPAQAGLFDDAEARKEIIRIRDGHNARLEALEAGSRAQLELSNRSKSSRPKCRACAARWSC